MGKRKVGILAECVCDLPKSLLNRYGVDILYFLVETESGIFTDSDEITAENVIYYLDNSGGKMRSSPPPPDVYYRTFTKNLKRYDELILVAISSEISASCKNAREAANMIGADGKRVHIFDSQHLSTGLGLLVLHAAELADEGCDCERILSELDELKKHVSTSFIARNADYLYRNGHVVSAFVKKVCTAFRIHPILAMKNGTLKVKRIIFGNYDSACRSYIRHELKGERGIDRRLGFITHAGCSVKMLRSIISEAEKYDRFDELTVTNASATISGNCGPGTFGILYIKNSR